MKKYQEPTMKIVRFDMTDSITSWQEPNDDDYTPGIYSENIEIWE